MEKMAEIIFFYKEHDIIREFVFYYLYYLWIMLISVLRVLVSNLVKESCYVGKKKLIF